MKVRKTKEITLKIPPKAGKEAILKSIKASPQSLTNALSLGWGLYPTLLTVR
jgi:hypothetical protein